MKKSDFHFDLPPELIAQLPLLQRGASRLLVLDGASGELTDKQFADLPELLHAGDLLVFNDTRVIPARLFGQKDSGGKIEVLVERILDSHRVLAHLRASKSPKQGARLLLEDCVHAEVLGRQGELFELRFDDTRSAIDVLEAHGHLPLPPYIERAADANDDERYQTVYGKHKGSVAAPTAGLHFDDEMLARLREMGVEFAYVTLHVGAGTFQPVRSDDIRDHYMHTEYLEVSAETCSKIASVRSRGGRVYAVGTTSVRSLESAACDGELQLYAGETDIFIYPGYRFRVIDGLITNFHLPESTLLMLVSALGGHDNIMRGYRHAVEQRYRFFSYGDAMLILPPATTRFDNASRD